MITVANTRIYPRAMMIKTTAAFNTEFAMFRMIRNYYLETATNEINKYIINII